jgi:DNA-binding response OmpR family regulator
MPAILFKERRYNMKILVIEDDAELVGLLRDSLRGELYTVDMAATVEQGEKMFETSRYDLMIIDAESSGRDGLQFCRKLRQKNPSFPILALNGGASEKDRLMAMEAGADFCLTKPFAFKEFFARVNALLRRSLS